MSDAALLLRAIAFSAQQHRNQRRKDVEASPYINHPIQVATILATVGGVADLTTLVAAILHDTVEDTETTPEELEERFGPDVQLLVAEVTDDKSLSKVDRKRLQVEHAPLSSVAAKLIKLADKISNVRDATETPPSSWSTERRREYFDWTERVIAGCRGTNDKLERHYDDTLRQARLALSRDA